MTNTNYIITSDGGFMSEDELYHYGVLGMKWGIHRAQSKMARNDSLSRRAAKYDVKAAKANLKSVRKGEMPVVSEENMSRYKYNMRKSAKYGVKSAKTARQAAKTDDNSKRLKYDKTSAKYAYKSIKSKTKALSLANESMYSLKSGKLALKAEKARYQIAKNKSYDAYMRRKASEVSEADLNNGYQFVKKYLES